MLTSIEVKCGNLCAMTTKLGQKKCLCKPRMMMTFMEVKGHQRSNVVNYELWLPNLVRRIPDESIMMLTSIEVKGHQRSNVVIYALLLNGVTRIHDASLTMTFMKVKGHQMSNVLNFNSASA